MMPMDTPSVRTAGQKIEDYADKLEARADRLHAAADRAYGEYKSQHDTAHNMASAIPFGQPILIGHHSERRDRNYRDRIYRGFKRAFEQYDKSKRLRERAEAAENNTAIRTEDPAGVLKLRDKIAQAEEKQAEFKRVNKAVRKALKQPESERVTWLAQELGYKEKTAASLLEPDFAGRTGVPSYMLSNNSANIRRMKKRLTELEARAQQIASADNLTPKPTWAGVITLIEDVEDNRLRIEFPGKPSPEHRKLLKSRGFRWSPSNKAWQRHLNNGARYDAKSVIEQMQSDS